MLWQIFTTMFSNFLTPRVSIPQMDLKYSYLLELLRARTLQWPETHLSVNPLEHLQYDKFISTPWLQNLKLGYDFVAVFAIDFVLLQLR